MTLVGNELTDSLHSCIILSCDMGFPTMWYLQYSFNKFSKHWHSCKILNICNKRSTHVRSSIYCIRSSKEYDKPAHLPNLKSQKHKLWKQMKVQIKTRTSIPTGERTECIVTVLERISNLCEATLIIFKKLTNTHLISINSVA